MKNIRIMFLALILTSYSGISAQSKDWSNIMVSKNGEDNLKLGEVIETNDLPVILVFFSEWCYPCRKIFEKEVLDEINKLTDKVYFVSADDKYGNIRKTKIEYEKYYASSNTDIWYNGYNLMKFITGKTEFPLIALLEKDEQIKYIEKVGELWQDEKLIPAIKYLKR